MVIDADMDGRRGRCAIISNVEGCKYFRAKCFIDATGDAVLADLCGAQCLVAGHDWPNISPASLCLLYGGVDWADPAY